jgi:LysR family glycine cleavage system transcriptional activator
VTLTPAFATQWLMPRLGGFWSSHPDVAVTLHPDRELVAIGRGGADVAIRYGKGPWPGLSSEMLVAAQFVIAAAPRLLGGRTALTLDQMSKMPWILEDDWPEQLAWLRDQGIDPKALKATRVPTDELGIVAARQGYGLYIEAAALVQDDVDAGRLIVVHHAQPEGLGYHIVTRPGYQPPALKPFVRWLRSVA